VPYDFDWVNHGNERQGALAHLKMLNENDVGVDDRGYFSYAMLYYHKQSGRHPIFRLQKRIGKTIDNFRNGDAVDQLIQL